MSGFDIKPTPAELNAIFRIKYGDVRTTGWGPRMRLRFDYFTPDDYYEAVVAKLVTADSMWLDVGCGHRIFPSNEKLAQVLARRCTLLVGVDPDETLDENTVVHQRIKSTIEDFQSTQTFDVITLRMVAEHISDPKRAVTSLARLTTSGGKVVVYTVNRWSPVPVITGIVPFSLHDAIKWFLWKTESKDTFPVCYRMNTRTALARVFDENGFQECYFAYLDDCRTFSRFRATSFLELFSSRVLQTIGFRYPESCLLGVYRRL